MSNSIENALKAVGDMLMSEIEAERARASIAENSMKLLVDGLRGLLAELPRSANDSEPLQGQHSKVVGNCAPRSIIADEVFFGALTTDWITAGNLRKILISRGITIAEGTVYNRMRTLVAKRPNQIQAASKPERWRLRAPEGPTSPAPQHVKFVAKRTSPQNPNLSIVPNARASLTRESSAIPHPVLHHGDCLEVMKSLPDDSVDLILADLPYGTTQLAIDDRLNLDGLWTEYRRILRKPHGNIVLFGSQPFTTALINAAPDIFRYSLVWDKNSSTGFQHAGSKPLKKHEDILVFSFGVNISEKRTNRRATFNDQHAVPVTRTAKGRTKVTFLKKAIRGYPKGHEYGGLKGCQNTVLTFPKDATKRGEKSHPFAKPIALLELLIRTYSNAGEVVLDNTMGSGSTGIAAINAGRHFIGIEKDEGYFALATKRMKNEIMPMAA